MFSSIAATWGVGGHGSTRRRTRTSTRSPRTAAPAGCPRTSVAWGLWARRGPRQSSDARAGAGPQPLGSSSMDPELGQCCALGPALARAPTAFSPSTDVDWDGLAATWPRPAVSKATLLRAAAGSQAVASGRRRCRRPDTAASHWRPRGRAGHVAGRLAGLSRAERTRLLTDLVRARLRGGARSPVAEAVEAAGRSSDMGFDSLTAVELRNRLNTATGSAAAVHGGLRLPDPGDARRHLRVKLSGELLERPAIGRVGRATAAAVARPIGRADRDRRHGLPAARRRARPGGALGTARRGRRRDRAVPRRPGLGPRRTCTTRTRTAPAPATCARAASCTTRREFDAGVLRHQPARGAGDGPAAAAAAGDVLGGAGTGRASTRRRCAARQTGVFVGAATSGYGGGTRPATDELGGLPADRQRDQRRLRPDRVHARPRGPGGHGGHGVLVVAGRAAPGRARRCGRASARSRWPAA